MTSNMSSSTLGISSVDTMWVDVVFKLHFVIFVVIFSSSFLSLFGGMPEGRVSWWRTCYFTIYCVTFTTSWLPFYTSRCGKWYHFSLRTSLLQLSFPHSEILTAYFWNGERTITFTDIKPSLSFPPFDTIQGGKISLMIPLYLCFFFIYVLRFYWLLVWIILPSFLPRLSFWLLVLSACPPVRPSVRPSGLVRLFGLIGLVVWLVAFVKNRIGSGSNDDKVKAKS